MIELIFAEHKAEGKSDIVEIWDSSELIGALYASPTGVVIHSKYHIASVVMPRDNELGLNKLEVLIDNK